MVVVPYFDRISYFCRYSGYECKYIQQNKIAHSTHYFGSKLATTELVTNAPCNERLVGGANGDLFGTWDNKLDMLDMRAIGIALLVLSANAPFCHFTFKSGEKWKILCC